MSSDLIRDFLNKPVTVEIGDEKFRGVLLKVDLTGLSKFRNVILQNAPNEWTIMRDWEVIKLGTN
jgi:small nuclear ribonucleoprotein (snRNP)-like protein